MKMKTLLRKIFFITFPSILALLIILEISLRIGGSIYMRYHSPQASFKASTGNHRTTILCLGDSYTYGVGAPFESSYPRQLEQILNANEEGKISVQNLGSPGGNSYRILNILRENIPEYNPGIIVVMVGMNNYWNMEGVQRFYQKGILNRFRSFVYESRIYKLWEIVSLSLKKKMVKPFVNVRQCNVPRAELEVFIGKIAYYKRNAEVELALKETRNMLAKYPHDCSSNAQLAGLLRETGDYDSAIRYAKKALEYAPPDPQHNAYLHLELLYDYRAKKDWKSARQEIDLVLPDPTFIESALCELRNICNPESGLSFDQEVKSLRKLITRLHGWKGAWILDTWINMQENREEKLRIIKEDLLQLIKISRENNIKTILMTYPQAEDSNEVARKVALELGIPLIDNELDFEGRPDKETFFNLDRHCNAKGYKLIATNLYSKLVKSGLLPEIKNNK